MGYIQAMGSSLTNSPFTDTETLYTDSTQQICDEFGKTYTWELKSKVMGKGENDVAKIMTGNSYRPIEPNLHIETR